MNSVAVLLTDAVRTERLRLRLTGLFPPRPDLGSEVTMHPARWFATILVLVGCSRKDPLPPQAADSAKPLLTLAHSRGLGNLIFDPGGDRMAAGERGYNSAIRVWDTKTGEELLQIAAHTNSISGLAFSPDGKQLASGSGDGTVKLWNAVTGDPIRAYAARAEEGQSWMGGDGVAFSPKGDWIASGAATRTRQGKRQSVVTIWNASTGDMLHSLPTDYVAEITSIAFGPTGDRIAGASYNDSTVHVWSLPSGEELYALQGHTEGVLCVSFSADGRQIATGSNDRTIKLWSADTGQEVSTLGTQGELGYVYGVEFSPDDSELASASGFGVHLWDPATGRLLRTLQDPSPDRKVVGVRPLGWSIFSAHRAVFSPDGGILGSICRGGKILVWELE